MQPGKMQVITCLLFSVCFFVQSTCYGQDRIVDGVTYHLADSGTFIVYTTTTSGITYVGHMPVSKTTTQGFFCLRPGGELMPLRYADLKEKMPEQKAFLRAAQKIRWSYHLWEKEKKSHKTWVNYLYDRYAG